MEEGIELDQAMTADHDETEIQVWDEIEDADNGSQSHHVESSLLTSESDSISSPAISLLSDYSSDTSYCPAELSDCSETDEDGIVNQELNQNQCLTFQLVGDNIDKNISPHDVRLDSQTQSLHLFQVYAVKDRIDFSSLDDNPSLPDKEQIQFDSILPSEEDYTALTMNMCQLPEY